MSKVKIGVRTVSSDSPPYFIADIAANHDGDLSRAYKLIELAKEAGADAAKFQNFKARKIVSRFGFDSMGAQLSHQAKWEKSVFEVYQDASLAEEWNAKLFDKCAEVGIEYMTSPYDFESVDQVNPYLNAYKIGSGDITWTEILRHIAKKGKPVILATGASAMEDVERAVSALLGINPQLILMQCNTNYTGSADNFRHINLNVLKTYQMRYPDLITGLSDHTPGHVTVLGAITLGARVIEKHFTDDNTRTGPDHVFSMNPTAWKEMVLRSRDLFDALGDGVKVIEENERDTVLVQRRALYLLKNKKAGERIEKADLFPLRPIRDGGIPPYEISGVVGKTAKNDLYADHPVTWEDLI